jgi:segregation and condensation protein B
MVDEGVQVELKQVLGALIFSSKRPLKAAELRRLLEEAASDGEAPAAFKGAKDKDIVAALEQLRQDLEQSRCGCRLAEGPEGYLFQSDPAAGPWVRHLLDAGKPARLSRPALETLAIIAYRQPITRAEIEGVRGVTVDHVIRMLMEAQLVRIVGRSELPGRPLLYGTTAAFLEHFGLKELRQLPAMDELSRLGALQRPAAGPAAAAPETGGAAAEPAAVEREEKGAAAAGDAGAAETTGEPPPAE